MPAPVLLAAHPGHELLLHGWIGRERPEVRLLTDGSGSARSSRTAASRELLREIGARCGRPFGDYPDADVYAALLAGRTDLFLGLADALALDLARGQVPLLVTDAAEGYNPTHDVCRAVAAAAGRLAASRYGWLVGVYEYALVGRPDGPVGEGCLRVELSAAEFRAKLEAARRYEPLGHEVSAAVARWGPDAFRTEVLRPADAGWVPGPDRPRPYYEEYGEVQVRAGRYPRVLRYREHVWPLIGELDFHCLTAAGRLALPAAA